MRYALPNPDRAKRIEPMASLKILSGGAAQGLVGHLSAAFRTETGLDIEGAFGAVGAMADKLRAGEAADIVILTQTLIAKLGEERLISASRPRMSVRWRQRSRSAARSSGVGAGSGGLAYGVARLGCDLRARYAASTAGIHVARMLAQLGIAHEVEGRLKVHPNGATAMRHLAQSGAQRPDWLHAIHRDHQHAGREAVRHVAAGLRTGNDLHRRYRNPCRRPRQALALIDC